MLLDVFKKRKDAIEWNEKIILSLAIVVEEEGKSFLDFVLWQDFPQDSILRGTVVGKDSFGRKVLVEIAPDGFDHGRLFQHVGIGKRSIEIEDKALFLFHLL